MALTSIEASRLVVRPGQDAIVISVKPINDFNVKIRQSDPIAAVHLEGGEEVAGIVVNGSNLRKEGRYIAGIGLGKERGEETGYYIQSIHSARVEKLYRWPQSSFSS